MNKISLNQLRKPLFALLCTACATNCSTILNKDDIAEPNTSDRQNKSSHNKMLEGDFNDFRALVQNLSKDYRPEDGWILWDIDNVIIEASEPAYHLQNVMRHRSIIKDLMRNCSNEERDIAINLSVVYGKGRLLYDRIPEMIKEYDAHKFNQLGFTASLPGRVGDIADFCEYRLQQLRSLQIEFSATSEAATIFDQTPIYRGNKSQFKNGVIFANGDYNPDSKKNALEAYILSAKKKPRFIVMIDDNEKHLKSVSEKLSHVISNEIDFYGFKLNAALTSPIASVDERSFTEAWDRLIKIAKEK